MSGIKSSLYRLLRWSEKYTKTDMVYLASGGFWSILAQVVSAVAVLAFSVIVARYLPKDVYGEYKYIIATVSILFSFSLTGIGSAVFQSIVSGFDGSLREGFLANLRWSAFAFIGSLGLSVYYFTQGNSILAFGILVGGSLSPLLSSANLANYFLNGKKDFARGSLYFGITETLLSVGALSVTVLLTHNPLTLVTVYFASNLLATFWIYRRVVRIYKPDATKTDSGMLPYAKHLSLMGILSGIAGNIDQILLFHFVGPIQLAVYNFAIAIPNQTKGPLKMLNTMVQVNFVNRSNEEIRVGMRNKLLWLAVTSAAFIATYILVAPYFYRFFFPNYMGAVFYSQLFALSLFANIFTPSTSYLAAKKKVREQYINNIISSIFQIGAVVIGVIWWGLLGLIVARILTRFFSGIFSYGLYVSSSRN